MHITQYVHTLVSVMNNLGVNFTGSGIEWNERCSWFDHLSWKTHPKCRHYLLMAAIIKGQCRRELGHFATGFLSHWWVHLAIVTNFFRCRLMTSRSPRIQQTFSARLALRRHSALWTEQLPDSPPLQSGAVMVWILGFCPVC